MFKITENVNFRKCAGLVGKSFPPTSSILNPSGASRLHIFKTEKGEYVSPSPIELKLSKNTDIEQVCVVGTLLPQTIALVVLSEEARKKDRAEIISSLEASMKEVNPTLEKHERMKKCIVMKDDWTVENAMLTPTMKIKRNVIEEKHQDTYTTWYAKDGSVVWE